MEPNHTGTTESVSSTLDEADVPQTPLTRGLIAYIAVSLLAMTWFALWLEHLPSPTSPLEHWLGVITIAAFTGSFVFSLSLLLANVAVWWFRGRGFLCEDHMDSTAMVLLMCIFPGWIGPVCALGLLFPS